MCWLSFSFVRLPESLRASHLTSAAYIANFPETDMRPTSLGQGRLRLYQLDLIFFRRYIRLIGALNAQRDLLTGQLSQIERDR